MNLQHDISGLPVQAALQENPQTKLLAVEQRIAVRVENLFFSWPGSKRPALNGVSFTIGKGERLALLGSNGSGKSTLLGCLNALNPAEGVTVYDDDGRPLHPKEQPECVRRILGTVSQNPDEQILGASVEEDAAFGPENLGMSRNEIKEKVGRILCLCGLEKLRRRAPWSLSGGEKQRLALAGVLAMDSQIVALDEAVSMLDGAGRETFLSLLDTLSAAGKTIIQVTHSLEEAFRCERSLVLYRGKLVFDGTPGELLKRPEIEDWGFVPDESLLSIRLLKKTFPGFAVSGLDPRETAEALRTLAGQEADWARGPELENPAVCGGIEAHSDSNVGKQAPLPAVEFQSVSHKYFGGTGIFDVNFQVPAGALVAMVGASGSGKSTALKHVNALLLPSRGRVIVLGEDTADRGVKLAALRARAAMAVQSPESALFEDFTADDIAFGPANTGLRGEALKERVREAMDETGLPFDEFADRKTRALSGGEKRLAAVAGVAAMNSPVLLLDEPFAGLDGTHRKKIWELLQRRSGRGASVLFSTHSMETAAACDFVAVMSEGALAAFGPPGEIFGQRWDPAWGLVLPWTAAAARAAGPVLNGTVPLNAGELLACVLGQSLFLEEKDALASAPRESVPLQKNKRRKTGLEFFRQAGAFQERPSYLRSLSGGLKLSLLCAGLAAAALPAPPGPAGPALIPAALLAAILAAGRAAGKTGPRLLLRGMIPLLPWAFMVAALQVFTGGQTALVRAASMVLQLAFLSALFSLYSAVTPLRETLRAVNAFFSAFLPKETAQDFSMGAGVALRFVSALAEEAERIVTAQFSRGGKKSRLTLVFSMIVPLFLRALERSEKLAKAFSLRLYGWGRK
jgi:energy-coupling factor transport system ATP-binding protein